MYSHKLLKLNVMPRSLIIMPHAFLSRANLLRLRFHRNQNLLFQSILTLISTFPKIGKILLHNFIDKNVCHLRPIIKKTISRHISPKQSVINLCHMFIWLSLSIFFDKLPNKFIHGTQNYNMNKINFSWINLRITKCVSKQNKHG